MPSLPTGTVTFLFTDIEGSTTLLQRLGDRRYAEVLAEHQRLLRDAFAKGTGQEIDTQGDAFLVAFPRARDAVGSAVAAQRALAGHAWPDGASLRVRMGLHTGEPLIGGTGYVGIDVHRAARIASAGHGGQILVSRAVSILAAGDLPPGVSLRELGAHRLKDLKEREHLLQVVHPDLPSEFPPLRSLDAHPHNLPIQLTSFIGRAREIAEVKRLLAAGRLVTLTGSGGAGKTRLALQVAADVVEGYPDGVWLVEFAPIVDPALVAKTVASALNVPEQPGRDITETLVNALRPKALLLVLDNCEHLLAACADLAAAVLRTCPQVQILTTSREGLGVPGEALWRVPSLSLPDVHRLPPSEDLVLYEAVRLFVDRAVATAPGFAVTRENAIVVAQLCHRLDGIPLALELAAARVRVLTVEQIAARLDNRFRLLTGGSRTVLPRHQTLRAAMDWSYDLLSEKERAVLRRLAVFAGGWTLEAAEAVCTGDEAAEHEVLDLLTQLVDKSLVLAEPRGGEVRYRLSETVLQYSRDRLMETGEAGEMRRRHRDWYLKLAERAEPELWGAQERAWKERLDVESDNLRAALEWSEAEVEGTEAGLRLAGALAWFWHTRGRLREGRQWFERLLSKPGGASAVARAKALAGGGMLIWRLNEHERAVLLLRESLALFQKLNDAWGMGFALHFLAHVSAVQGNVDRALAEFEQSLAHFREAHDDWWSANTLDCLSDAIADHQGDYARAAAVCEESLALFVKVGAPRIHWPRLKLARIADVQGDYVRAAALAEECLKDYREAGHPSGTATSLARLAYVAQHQGHHRRAAALFRDCLFVRKDLGDRVGLSRVLEGLAGAVLRMNRPVEAAKVFGVAERLREVIGAPLSAGQQADYEANMAALRSKLDEPALAVAWDEGRAMTLEQAIEYALTGTESGP